MQRARRPGSSQLRLALRLAGAGLLIAAGAIHLDLYLTGYRSIPVIGWLFLFQVIAAFVLAVVVLASGLVSQNRLTTFRVPGKLLDEFWNTEAAP